MTEQLNIGAEIFHQRPSTIYIRESSGFNVGAIYDLSENWHILTSAGSRLQNASSSNRFSYYAGVQLTF